MTNVTQKIDTRGAIVTSFLTDRMADKKEGVPKASNLPLALTLIVLLIGLSVGAYFIIEGNKNSKAQDGAWSGQIARKRKGEGILPAIEMAKQLLSSEHANPESFILYCEIANLHIGSFEYEKAWNATEMCWKEAQNRFEDPTSRCDQILKYCKKMYHRAPTNVGEQFARLVLDLSEISQNLLGYYMAAHSFGQDGLWKDCEDTTMKGLEILSDNSPLGLRKNFHILHSTALMEQHKYLETISFFRKITSVDYVENDLWNQDVQLLEYLAECLVQTSHSKVEIDNSIHYLEKKVNALGQGENFNSFELRNFLNLQFHLSQLYLSINDYTNANKYALSIWEKAWNAEISSNPAWSCTGNTGAVIPSFFDETEYTEIPLSSPPPTEKKQYHSNLSILSSTAFAVSAHLGKPISSQQMFGYTIHDATVQFSSFDRDLILISTACTLHGFNDLLRQQVVSSLMPAKGYSSLVLVENAFLLHWKPLAIHHWIVECLPKLKYLIDNDWMGQWDSTVLLPYSQEIKEYLDLLEIGDDRITWVKRSMTYQVENLSILDYKAEKATKMTVIPHPPVYLLNSLRGGLIGETMDVDIQDIILVVQGTDNSSIVNMNLVHRLRELVEGNEKMEQIQRVVHLDTEGSVYHQIFAYKRARVVISDSNELLGNTAWMSPRATIIEVSDFPIQKSHTYMTASKLKLEHKLLPTDPTNPQDQQTRIVNTVADLFQ